MANKYDQAVNELKAIKSPYNVSIGYKPMRNKAKNIVEVYGQEYKSRFDNMVTFNKLGDIRSDEEKHRVLLEAIDNAIHFYENKSLNEKFTSVDSAKKSHNTSNKLINKFLAFIPALIIVSMSFLIYNNHSAFNWYISGWQWFIISIGGLLFLLSFFLHKINDKWLAVLLVPFSLIFEAILKFLGLPL